MRSAPPLSRNALRILVAMVAIGTAVRLAVAFNTYGVPFDEQSFEMVRRALADPSFSVYDLPPARWPYPPGFLGFVRLAGGVAHVTRLPFHALVHVPSILADGVIAVVVQHWLRFTGRAEPAALLAAALVVLGPSFAIVSGYHGQIDAVAILPAVVGVLAWERGGRRRGLVAGVFIGLGAAVKSTPAFCALALLPTARSWRERAVVLSTTAAVPLSTLVPWLASEPRRTLQALTYNKGVGGYGGLSAFIEPSLTRYWSTSHLPVPRVSSLLGTVSHYQNIIVGCAVLAVAALFLRRRTPALEAASGIWLAVYVVNPNFAYPYLVWGMPFFLLAGHVRLVALFELAILPATVVVYFGLHRVDPTGWVYFGLIQSVWLALVAVAAIMLRSLLREPPTKLTSVTGARSV